MTMTRGETIVAWVAILVTLSLSIIGAVYSYGGLNNKVDNLKDMDLAIIKRVEKLELAYDTVDKIKADTAAIRRKLNVE